MPLNGIGSKAKGKLAQQPMLLWGYILGLIALAVSSLFGGLGAAPGKPPAAVNTAIEAGPWKVTIAGARLVGELLPMRLSDKNNYFIVVLATVEITADHTWKYLNEVVQLAPVDGVKAKVTKTDAGTPVQLNDGIVLLRDATKINQLNPGMPEKLAYFWELTGTSRIPSEVTVYIGNRVYEISDLTNHHRWSDNSEHNDSVIVRVDDRRDATAASS